MDTIQITGIIRNRGQFTIPEEIRREVNWVSPLSAVDIIVEKPNEIRIVPHKQQTKTVNWDKIWEGIKRSRSIKGNSTLSAAEIIERDRHSH